MPRLLKTPPGAPPPEAAAPERLSRLAENYLLALHILKEQGLSATAGHLAEHLRTVPVSEGLGTTLPTVLGMLRRMARENLVELAAGKADKEVRLTPQGLLLAEGMVRRHRLAERMVVDLLGMELDKAHEEAHRLEHAISPELETKIRERLGNPTTCPFGGPIPGSGYTPPSTTTLTLDMAVPNVRHTIDRVPEGSPDLVRFLVEKGILPEREITVLEASPHRGVVTVQTDRGEGALGYEAAARIRVRRAEE